MRSRCSRLSTASRGRDALGYRVLSRFRLKSRPPKARRPASGVTLELWNSNANDGRNAAIGSSRFTYRNVHPLDHEYEQVPLKS
jgi:hypothetical protein